ncbi:MAG: hypothetical protein EZS28_028701 [Streblomastix strix]|uniref:Uncharacterized protein n=1 Tax=Streblomastix strix TaxID=222440 RepID=A0A5J4UZW2_9EUKA|nr:MAG: hypothetical protein EZS28_028701 [Streblomastix strix]
MIQLNIELLGKFKYIAPPLSILLQLMNQFELVIMSLFALSISLYITPLSKALHPLHAALFSSNDALFDIFKQFPPPYQVGLVIKHESNNVNREIFNFLSAPLIIAWKPPLDSEQSHPLNRLEFDTYNQDPVLISQQIPPP